MLQPRIYPQLIGKSLVLEAEPFIEMVEDDNPWVEGLFFTFSIGLLVGVARLIGGLLLTASLPDQNIVLDILLQTWRQLAQPENAIAFEQFEATVYDIWFVGTGMVGYRGNWSRLLVLMLFPLWLLIQWLCYGLTCHISAKALGGTGTFNQSLGATALMTSPAILLLLTAIPFVSVSGLLLFVWTMLIVYRSIEVAHDLPWHRAAYATAIPIAIFFSLLIVLLVGGGFMLMAGRTP